MKITNKDCGKIVINNKNEELMIGSRSIDEGQFCFVMLYLDFEDLSKNYVVNEDGVAYELDNSYNIKTFKND